MVKRPLVSEEHFDQVMRFGYGGESFDEALDRLLEREEPARA